MVLGEIEKLNSANLLLLLQFLAPGLLIVYFRSLFVRRVEASVKDNALLYIVLSVLYGFVTVPAWTALGGSEIVGLWRWLSWCLTLLVVPIALGVALGVDAQHGWSRAGLSRAGLNPLSPYRTGWDWAFGQVSSPVFLLITMDDGSQVAGLFGEGSLAASDHNNRDVFLEAVYDVGDDGSWTERSPRQSILISGKSIRYIEFEQGGDRE